MSNKSSKATKKPSVPREMSEIQADYQRACANLGQTEYQISVYAKEKDALRQRLENINREASARQQLDRQAAQQSETKNDTQTETAGA